MAEQKLSILVEPEILAGIKNSDLLPSDRNLDVIYNESQWSLEVIEGDQLKITGKASDIEWLIDDPEQFSEKMDRLIQLSLRNDEYQKTLSVNYSQPEVSANSENIGSFREPYTADTDLPSKNLEEPNSGTKGIISETGTQETIPDDAYYEYDSFKDIPGAGDSNARHINEVANIIAKRVIETGKPHVVDFNGTPIHAEPDEDGLIRPDKIIDSWEKQMEFDHNSPTEKKKRRKKSISSKLKKKMIAEDIDRLMDELPDKIDAGPIETVEWLDEYLEYADDRGYSSGVNTPSGKYMEANRRLSRMLEDAGIGSFNQDDKGLEEFATEKADSETYARYILGRTRYDIENAPELTGNENNAGILKWGEGGVRGIASMIVDFKQKMSKEVKTGLDKWQDHLESFKDNAGSVLLPTSDNHQKVKQGLEGLKSKNGGSKLTL
jgi:hypothetical protein